MAHESTPEYAKDLYELAVNVHRGKDIVYAIRLFEALLEIGDHFYSAYALAFLAQCYKSIARPDLERATFARVTGLPKNQQNLLNPSWLAVCYQRIGELGVAETILTEVLRMTPDAHRIQAGLAEVYLLRGKFTESMNISEALRNRPENEFQILGRMLHAFALALLKEREQSEREFLWVGQFLVSSGKVPIESWDYRDLQELVAKTGPNAETAEMLISVLTGSTSLEEFSRIWNEKYTSADQHTA